MKGVFFLGLMFMATIGHSQARTEIERINFFPKANNFVTAVYDYRKLTIETPKSTLLTKAVRHYSNALTTSYAQRLGPKLFVGLMGTYEQASENAVSSGIPQRSRFTGHGLKEPELFLIYRLRGQEGQKGLLDLQMAFSPSGGKSEVGKDTANRLNGRNIFRLGLSHGLLEDEWEFKSFFLYEYFGKGVEENDFTEQTYVLESYSDVTFQFQAQYALSPWAFVYGSVGAFYRGTQAIIGRNQEEREIQAGTGSVFQGGLKKPLNDWSLVELRYTYRRNDYFIKGLEENLEGELYEENFRLRLVMVF